MAQRVMAVVSGGADSIAMAYMYAKRGELAHVVSFDYGQRHRKELEHAKRAASDLSVAHTVVDLGGIFQHVNNNVLTGDNGGTVVQGRNAIMLSSAWAIAVANGCDAVAAGFQAGDSSVFADCRREFADPMRVALERSTDHKCLLLTPFIYMQKYQVIQQAKSESWGVPWVDTWSCYRDGDIHCGECSTCVERREAFAKTDETDWTLYDV